MNILCVCVNIYTYYIITAKNDWLLELHLYCFSIALARCSTQLHEKEGFLSHSLGYFGCSLTKHCVNKWITLHTYFSKFKGIKVN